MRSPYSTAGALAAVLLLTFGAACSRAAAGEAEQTWTGGPLETARRQPMELRVPARTWTTEMDILAEWVGSGSAVFEIDLGSPPVILWWDTGDPRFTIALRHPALALLTSDPGTNTFRLGDHGGTATVAIASEGPWTVRVATR